MKNILYRIFRNYVKKYLTGHLGKVVEKKDRLVCYVNKKRCKKEKLEYKISCLGNENENIAKKYNLNKPICYVLDGINFDKQTYIFGWDNCEIYIKNCSFPMGTYIKVNGKCTIENTDIKDINLLMISADELILKDIDLNNFFKYFANLKVIIGATNKMEIINSKIGREKEKINLSLLSQNELKVVNSKVAGDIVECKANEMNCDDQSSISASKKLTLKVNEFEKINIISPNILLNGNNIYNKDKSLVLKKLDDDLIIKRMQLLDFLRKLEIESELRKTEKVDEYINTLNNLPIHRVLKK